MNGWTERGTHQALWDGRDAKGTAASSGVYMVQLEVTEQRKQEAFSQAKRITLIR